MRPPILSRKRVTYFGQAQLPRLRLKALSPTTYYKRTVSMRTRLACALAFPAFAWIECHISEFMMNNIIPYASVIGRIFIAAIFIISGIGKITGYAETQAYMDSMSVPAGLLPLVIIFELAGGIAIVVGWQTRIVALLLAGFTLLSAALFHGDIENETQMIMLLKNIAIAGGFLFLVANGPGGFALDNRNA